MKKKLIFFCLKFDMGEDDEEFYNEVTTFVDEYNALPGPLPPYTGFQVG